MECRHYNGVCCKNGKSDNYGKTCQEYDCNDRQGYYDRVDEILHSYLSLENNTLVKINNNEEYDYKTKKHLNNIYASKVELLEELIREIYGY